MKKEKKKKVVYFFLLIFFLTFVNGVSILDIGIFLLPKGRSLNEEKKEEKKKRERKKEKKKEIYCVLEILLNDIT